MNLKSFINVKKSKLSNKMIGLWVLILVVATPAINANNYPLEIIQPQANLDVKNRFYKAYPSLEYNVKVAVVGGTYPYSFELKEGPEGMEMSAKGEISWGNPEESNSPYPVHVIVTDSSSEPQITDVRWGITVTKEGFRFIDSINGSSAGDGTISSPWKSVKDLYEGDDYAAKYKTSYRDEFVYWREGQYIMDAFKEDNGRRTAFTSGKPRVWLAYPGEVPVLDLSNAYIAIYSGVSNTYIDGFKVNANGNSRGMAISIDGSASNVTIRRNEMYGISNGYTGGNNSLVFIERNENSGENVAIQDNILHDVSNGYGLLGYSANNVLVESNRVYNISNGHAISPKMSTEMWFIRDNIFSNNSGNSINLQYYSDGGSRSGDIEISHNLIKRGGGRVRINSNYTSVGKPVYIFRNTIMENVDVNKVTSTNGRFAFENNVIINESNYSDKIEKNDISSSERLLLKTNLVGARSQNIVNENGILINEYKGYLGARGHMLGDVIKPQPPEVSVN